MSAGLLRKAAALMRERAENATPGPWFAVVGQGPKRRKQQVALVGRADMRGQGAPGCIAVLAGLGSVADVGNHRADDAEHIASWHPAVALAVADWLDVTARDVGTSSLAFHAALDLARTYLGESS